MTLITKPGIYDLTMEAYHGQCADGPSVSSTDLRTLFTQSPAHMYVRSSINPDKEEQADTEAFVLGRAAHHLLLGEADFSKHFVLRPETIDGDKWQGNRTVCKKWIADQTNAGLTVIKGDQIKQIRGMAKSLAKHPLVQAGILNGDIEKSLLWKDKETGIWCKSRPDAIPNDSGDFGDLKTSTDIGYKLDYSVEKYRYDVQAAMVGMGCKAVLGRPMTEFSFIFVEKEAPYSVDVLTLDAKDIEAAEHDIRVALNTVAYCLKTGDWFGPSGTQSDARYVHLSDRGMAHAKARRQFLMQEIQPAAMVQAAE